MSTLEESSNAAEQLDHRLWVERMQVEREFFVDNILVRIRFIIVMIRWTGLMPWEVERMQVVGISFRLSYLTLIISLLSMLYTYVM